MTRIRHRQTFSTLALIAATAFIALPVAGQPGRPDAPPSPDQIPEERPAPEDPRHAVAEGTVKQYLMNPHGEVDGLLLSDGTQIHFPPHMGSELVAEIQPGNRISAQGERPDLTPLIRAATITNSQTRRTVVEHEPSWKDRPFLPG